MSTAGLRRVGTFQEALAAAARDDQRQEGIISPGLQLEATRIINSPDFQRVKDRLTDDLEVQERNHLEQKRFEQNVTNLSVDARVNRSDMDYIIRNLQQPPPPPPPPPPATDAAADRVRMMAELDGMAQDRERQMRQEFMAATNAQQLAAQRVESPAQQIINQYVQPAAPQPVIVQPDMTSLTDMMRHFGQSMQQLFLQRQPPRGGPEDIPITMLSGGGGPPPAPGAGAVALADPQRAPYGPARPTRAERAAPFSGGGPPPPGGATAPMPVRPSTAPVRPSSAPVQPSSAPARPSRRRRKVEVAASSSSRPPDVPPSAPAVRVGKREGDFLGGPGVPRQPGMPRFPGQGRQLPAPAPFTPFSGQPQRIGAGPGADTLRAQALARMQVIGAQKAQRRRAGEMLDRQADLGRALRRGGERGDVVGPGKRKNEFAGGPFAPRQRIAREQYSIAT